MKLSPTHWFNGPSSRDASASKKNTFVTSSIILGDKFMPPFLVSKLTLWQVWEVWIESVFSEINILHGLEICHRQNQTIQCCKNRIWFFCGHKSTLQLCSNHLYLELVFCYHIVFLEIEKKTINIYLLDFQSQPSRHSFFVGHEIC